jgi:hypothetical protein
MFDGGRWYPIGVRRVLENESYVGRLIYRRSRWIKARGKDGRMRRKQVDRPAEDQVEIVGASPRMIDDKLWQRVQQIINAPERIARRPKLQHECALRGRVKCQLCGSAMVGHTMIDNGRPYHYYHCRLAFDRRSSRACSGRNIRAERLETAIWQEIGATLTSPEIILQELGRGRPEPDQEELDRLEQELGRITERERRLIKLYSYGEIGACRVQATALGN